MANNSVVQNPEQQVPKTPEMNDRDYLNDVLSTEKYLTDSFNIAAREASHDALFQDVMQVLTENHTLARNTYNLMFQKGWYKVEKADAQKIQQTANQFQGYKSQFPQGQMQ
ncbi:spore coat protein [Alicyclobacillus fastidiosus]|uniref:Spore coat protein n=1 Tax=Alicyclobacillus fastidiosus TaxID=392011 RepID=A0ABV5AJ82_9BACL|nr:spore coat protein [Alicyclobacillus fastidiosus]WEH09145.1 spore coat protein [Alicyclobacillus fastidiosus]